MKTRRAGSILVWYFFHRARRRATSGRSCSAGSTLFFEAHSLAMDEIPDRAIADGNAAFGEFRHEPAHGHLGLGRDPLHEPAPFSNESAGPMAPHLPTRGAAALACLPAQRDVHQIQA